MKGGGREGRGVPNDRRVEFTSLMRPRLRHPSKSKSFLRFEEGEDFPPRHHRPLPFVLNSSFPWLSSNYFSRTFVRFAEGKKSGRHSRLERRMRKERAEREALLLEGMRLDRKVTVTSRALDRPRGDPCFLSKTLYRIIRLSRQAAVLHQNSSAPLIHFRITPSFVREAEGNRIETSPHAFVFYSFSLPGFFKRFSFFSSLFSSYDYIQFFTRFGQVYICTNSVIIPTKAWNIFGRFLN